MANYVVSDTSLTSVADAIRTKGGTSAALAYPAGFVSAISAIPTGGTAPVEPKDVNFYDYDGTITNSYTAQEFAALSAMPANPSHTGLTAQGWNWTLSDAKTYVTSYGKLNIGQMYTTVDGKTRIYIRLEGGRLSPTLGLCPNGSVDVDWGDGSAHSTVTGTSVLTLVNTQHIYAAAGDYVIALTVTGSCGIIGSSSYGSQLIWKNSTTAYENRVYQNTIRRVELGSGMTGIGSYAFYNCYSLVSVTIPSGVTSLSEGAFYFCYFLPSVTIPGGVTSIGSRAFQSCESLSSVTFPNSVTSIGGYAFAHCHSLLSVTIPSSVTSIDSNAFYGCYSFPSLTIPNGVTSIGSYAFYNCYSLKSLTIPSSVTTIGDRVFSYCYSLVSATIPSSTAGSSIAMFSSCYSLVSATVPSGVTSIASNTFTSCYGLAEIHIKPASPPTVSNADAWKNLPTDCVIYVPSGSLSAYTSATNYPSSSTYTYVEE